MLTPIDILSDSSPLANSERAKVLFRIAVPSSAGAGASAPVVTAVGAYQPLPAAYAVIATPDQAAFVSVSGKNSSGFNVTLTPPAGATLAAGNIDLILIG